MKHLLVGILLQFYRYGFILLSSYGLYRHIVIESLDLLKNSPNKVRNTRGGVQTIQNPKLEIEIEKKSVNPAMSIRVKIMPKSVRHVFLPAIHSDCPTNRSLNH